MSTDKRARGSSAESPSTEPTPEILAQAAAWIASLHDEDRTEKFEAGFRRWLAADPRHRTAFERANELWTEAECWPKARLPEAPPPRRGFGIVPSLSLATSRMTSWGVACIGVALLVWAVVQFHDPGFTTHVGEQRSMTLPDGSRVSLNTDTRIRIQFDREVRRVRVESGEALFEVAKRPTWPFVVVAGDRQITALGTVFVVRREQETTSVLLVEGKVQVAQLDQRASQPAVLVPGQRLTFPAHQPPVLDRPVVPTVVAWQRGQVIFDHTPLAEAVNEMNRYSELKLRLDSEPAGRFLVTGVFRAGDTESFVEAVTASYRMEAAPGTNEVVLKGGRDEDGL